MADHTAFVNELAAKTGLNKTVLSVWANLENGVNNNILGIRSPSGPLMRFSSQVQAADYTAQFLKSHSFYSGILSSASGTPAQQALAIAKSPWNLGVAGTKAAGGASPYYLKGFIRAGLLTSASFTPSGGVSTPLTQHPSSTATLGAWADQIKFPIGHILTAADVESIVNTLDANGWFGSGLAGLPSKEVTRGILKTHIGQAWNKSLENTLQSEFGTSADQANPISGLGIDLSNALMFVAIILVGIAFLFLGGIIVLKGPKGATAT